MEAVSTITREYGVKTVVSLNPIMVDGTGMCGACRVMIGGKPKFACVDGPEFDGHQVDFGDLATRLGAYREQERHAWDLHRGQVARTERTLER
jgi:ferredoxin--NADP+ reductase